jgi:hypothetical protein
MALAQNQYLKSNESFCLFDLDIELTGIVQNKYLLKFIEPYAIGQEQLIFEMDLTTDVEGEYCVIRKGYPWGG